MKNLKITFYPSKERISRKTKQIPLYLRISRGSTKTEVRLPVHISESEYANWDATQQRMSITTKNVNVEIDKIKDRFDGLRYTHKERYDVMSPQEVKSLLFHHEKQLAENSSLIEKIREYFEKSIKFNGNLVDGTVRNYVKSITHFEKYLKYEKKSQITISEFSPLLAHGFYEYLQMGIPEIGKVSMSDVSASSVLIKIKVIFNRWVDTEIIKTNPFKKVKLKTKTAKRESLSIDDVKKLKAYDFSSEPKLDVYRDLFMFQIYTGLAYGDVEDLVKADIEELGNGDFILRKKRKKTDVEVRQILSSGAINILNKYKSNIELRIDPNRLLPRRHLNNLNEALKVIQVKVGITKLMTTHIARHTCAQFIAECGIAYDVMDKMMGWSDRRQGTRAIYYRVSDNMLKEAKLNYDNFFKLN